MNREYEKASGTSQPRPTRETSPSHKLDVYAIARYAGSGPAERHILPQHPRCVYSEASPMRKCRVWAGGGVTPPRTDGDITMPHTPRSRPHTENVRAPHTRRLNAYEPPRRKSMQDTVVVCTALLAAPSTKPRVAGVGGSPRTPAPRNCPPAAHPAAAARPAPQAPRVQEDRPAERRQEAEADNADRAHPKPHPQSLARIHNKPCRSQLAPTPTYHRVNGCHQSSEKEKKGAGVMTTHPANARENGPRAAAGSEKHACAAARHVGAAPRAIAGPPLSGW
ncbi:hypothetical protein C8J57DRAFT_1238269 [Mycena rebaudengoi]|nr:hypothetical protein C8J57DRAFT_1238269 [Mycena rebaudengoi]